MQKQERNLPAEIVRGAFAAVWLPFTWAAGAPAAMLALVRRATRPGGEPGQSASAARLNTGKWTRELLKHLEWRRLEELCTAYFEELGFRTGITHDRADGGVDINLFAAGADSASILVHCKAWDADPIGIQPLRELRVALTSPDVADPARGDIDPLLRLALAPRRVQLAQRLDAGARRLPAPAAHQRQPARAPQLQVGLRALGADYLVALRAPARLERRGELLARQRRD